MDVRAEAHLLVSWVSLRLLFFFLLMFFHKAMVVVEDIAGLRTVPDKYRGCLKPVLEIVQRDRDVLGIVSVENPYFSRPGWLGDSVSIVME